MLIVHAGICRCVCVYGGVVWRVVLCDEVCVYVVCCVGMCCCGMVYCYV